jgi:WD40 repeat protein
MNRVFLIAALALGGLTARAADSSQYVLVSGKSGNAELVLIDPTDATGQPKNLTNHPARDCYPAWSPDGKLIAFASDRDNAGNIYAMDADGKNVRAVTKEKVAAARCYCPSFSADGKAICYGRLENGKGTVHTINVDGTNDRTILADAWDPAWSPDGSRIAFARQVGKAQRLCVCDPDGGRVSELRDVDNPLGFTLPAWSPDGTRIAYSEPAGGALELFLINADGSGRRQLTWAQYANVYPAWSADGATLVFIHMDQGGSGYLRINADGTQMDISPLTLIDRPDRYDFRPAFRPRPGMVKPANPIKLASHTKEKDAGLNVTLVARVRLHQAPTTVAPFSLDGKRLVSVAEDGTMAVCEWGPKGLRPLDGVRAHTAGVAAACWAPDGKAVLTSGRENIVKLWDVEKRDCRAVIHDAEQKSLLAAISPNGKTIAVGCEGRVVQIRDAESQKIQTRLELPGEKSAVITGLAFSPGSQTVVACGGDWGSPDKCGSVAAWDVKTGKKLWSVPGTFAGVWGVDYSLDGAFVAGACLDGTVRIWDAKTGTETKVLRGHTDRATGVAISPDGQRVASIGHDHVVRLWSVETGRQEVVLAGHVAKANRVCFAPDGKHLSSTAADGAVCLWRIEE